MAPMRRHTLQELQSLGRESLVDLVLDLEARNAELEATVAAKAGRLVAEGSALKNGVHEPGNAPSPQLKATANEPEPEDQARLPGGRLAPPKKLERAISKIPANTAAAAQLRAELAQVVESMVLERHSSSPECSEQGRELLRLTHSNFFLPDLRNHEPEFAAYIRSKLVAPYHQEALEDAEALNWAIGQDLSEEHRLHVLWTQSDGNCLLHATLLAMWGLHDTQEVVGTGGLSTLRAAMSRLFQEPRVAEPMRRRWVLQMSRDSQWEPMSQEKAIPDTSGSPPRPGRVEVSEAQLAREWAEMVDLAGRTGAFLDSVHVLALAHALRRPIVILASPMMRDPFGVPLTPIFFRGIYLPFERQPCNCCRQPLVLCFQDAHFMPVVPLAAPEGAGPVRVPLVDGQGEELPMRFALEEELERKWDLVHKYMDIESNVELPRAKLRCNMAVLRRDYSHPLVTEMMAHFVERGEATFAAEREEARCAASVQVPIGPKRKSSADLEADDSKRQKKSGIDGRQPQSSCSEASSATSRQDENEEPDAQVAHRWPVKLPRGLRPGDKTRFHMPKGCTDQDVIDFKVPRGSFEGDTVVLTANFKIKGHCIKALREVTQLPRAEAVALLTKVHGDADAAAREYFERLARSPTTA